MITGIGDVVLGISSTTKFITMVTTRRPVTMYRILAWSYGIIKATVLITPIRRTGTTKYMVKKDPLRWILKVYSTDEYKPIALAVLVVTTSHAGFVSYCVRSIVAFTAVGLSVIISLVICQGRNVILHECVSNG
jgi:hypothetical protein